MSDNTQNGKRSIGELVDIMLAEPLGSDDYNRAFLALRERGLSAGEVADLIDLFTCPQARQFVVEPVRASDMRAFDVFLVDGVPYRAGEVVKDGRLVKVGFLGDRNGTRAYTRGFYLYRVVEEVAW